MGVPQSRLSPLLRSLRPRHWIKNLACVLPVVFAGHAFEPRLDGLAFAAGLIFCAASSAVYLFNDVLDAERDRAHPVKRGRPVASGEISPGRALSASGALALAALWLGARMSREFALVVAFYLALNFLYSTALRERPLLSVVFIAVGFCARVIAGIIAIDAKMSPWIVLATFFSMLMIGFGKRRAEFAHENASGRRPYTPAVLDRFLATSGVLAVATYSLFTILSSPTPDLILTVPFVVYGIFRYMMLAETGAAVEFPERLVLEDAPTFVNGLLWITCYAFLAARSTSFFAR